MRQLGLVRDVRVVLEPLPASEAATGNAPPGVAVALELHAAPRLSVRTGLDVAGGAEGGGNVSASLHLRNCLGGRGVSWLSLFWLL
jgi:hypothetical protein